VSWQATAWAAKQRTGSAARKVLLLVLANYADEHGICWPSQETLKVETELSEDTIQRHCKHLVRLGLLKVSRRRRKSGTWGGKIYQLNMRIVTMPQNAVWSDDEKQAGNEPAPTVGTTPQPAADHTAMTTSTTPQALRHKPSLEEPSVKPSPTKPRKSVEARLRAFHEKQIGDEVIQSRIASRIGPDGWEVLQGISDAELQSITAAERAGNLDDEMLETLRLQIRRGAA
jgi:hypothetical protein